MNEYLISKLKEGRINKGLKQSDVTQFTGIKNTTLSNYENGITEPDIDTFLQLCELYELDYSRILSEAYGLSVQGEQFKIRPSEIEIAKKYRFISTHSPDGAGVVDTVLDREYTIAGKLKEHKEQAQKAYVKVSKKNIPLRLWAYYGKIACAGTGFIFDDIPSDTVEAPYRNDADFIIGVNGDSMEPDYSDGEKLYIQKTADIGPGEVGIFTINNECFLKEYGAHGLVSRNKKYDDIKGNEDVRLIGKVVGKVGE